MKGSVPAQPLLLHLRRRHHSLSLVGIRAPLSSRPPTSEDGSDAGHLPATVAAAFHLVRTLAVHLALVPAEAKRSQGKVHLGAGARLFCREKGVREWGGRRETLGGDHVSAGLPLTLGDPTPPHLTPVPPPLQTPLPQAPSSPGFRITGPRGESHLCLFLTLWPGPGTSQSPCRLGAEEEPCCPHHGCYNSNGGDRYTCINSPRKTKLLCSNDENE